jgi:NitT/TauT family transport system permease protein
VAEPIKTGLATAATFLLLLAAWTLAIDVFELSPQILPSPAAVAEALWHGWSQGAFVPHAVFTLQGALGGWAIGAVLGALAGAVVAESNLARRVLYPMVIAVQSMPTVAIAPLIVVYFGVDLPSKLVTVALLCFFPVFVNAVAGLTSADPRLLDLYRANGASRWRTLIDVKVPSAADAVLSGAQVAIVLSFIGAVVSEFVASRAGLGYLIKTFANDLNVAVMFAAIATLAVLGAGIGTALARLRGAVVFWKPRHDAPRR